MLRLKAGVAHNQGKVKTPTKILMMMIIQILNNII
jgi:hypothetical protein